MAYTRMGLSWHKADGKEAASAEGGPVCPLPAYLGSKGAWKGSRSSPNPPWETE